MKKTLFFYLIILSLFFFNRINSQNFSTQGSAQLTSMNPLQYTITPDQQVQAGLITNYFPLNLNSSLELNFEMNFGSKNSNGADGMAFTLSNLCNPTLPSGGGFLGIPSSNNILIVEFDTYDNDGAGNSDLSDDHLAIYKSGIPASDLANLIIQGSNIPVCILNNCGNIENNTFIPIKIKWIYIDATQQKLEVYINNILRATSTTANHIASIFSGNANVFWSISGATGSLSNFQRIRFPDFTNTFETCSGNSITLNAPLLGSNYIWSNNSSNTNVANYIVNSNQTVTCTYTDFCGQSKTVTFNLQAKTTPSPPATNSTITYCQNATANSLTATGTDLLWYSSATGGIGSTSPPIPSTLIAGTTTYYVTQTVFGCESARAAITIIVNPIPNVTSIESNSPICFGESANFTINGTPNATVTYAVNGGASTTTTINSSGVGTISIPNSITNVSLVLSQVNIGLCSSLSTLTENVMVLALPSITSVVTNSPVCSEDTAMFIINGTANSTVTFTLNGGTSSTIVLNTNGTNTISIDNATANQSLLLSNISVGNCNTTLTNTASIIVNPTPNFPTIAPQTETFCVGSDMVFNVIGGANETVTYTINNGSNQSLTLDALGRGMITIPNPTAIVTIDLVNITNGICLRSLTVSSDATLITCEIPKGFSPNGDGNNDTWDLSSFDIKRVEVYNRYGLKVYSKTSYTNQWSGKSDTGNELPTGTYYFMIEFNDRPSETGWVYINRGE